MPRTFHIHTFGCQMNVHDAEALAGLLERSGFEPARDEAGADIVLLETCSVRQRAEDKVWSLLGRLGQRKEHRPGLVIGVIGCMAEAHRGEIFRRAPHVDMVAGPGRLDGVPALLERLAPGGQPALLGHESAIDLPSAGAERGAHPWSAYLAVGRGCSNRCSYCIVPAVRGPQRSRPPKEIIEEAGSLVDQGAVEITLLGQNVDAYGCDLPNGRSCCLAGLLRGIGALESRGLARLRFVTSHPRDISEDLLRAVAETPPACPFLHMPAQSGSDRVLAAMRRGYTAARYREIVAAARRLVPDVEIASDFIVGFPGESEADYAATERLVREMEFGRIFGFKYSPRPGTRAEGLPDDVPAAVKKERLNRLFAVQQGIGRRLNEALVGRTVEVLVEGVSARDSQRLAGRTRDMRIATFPADGTRPGETVNVRVTAATALSLLGERV